MTRNTFQLHETLRAVVRTDVNALVSERWSSECDEAEGTKFGPNSGGWTHWITASTLNKFSVLHGLSILCCNVLPDTKGLLLVHTVGFIVTLAMWSLLGKGVVETPMSLRYSEGQIVK